MTADTRLSRSKRVIDMIGALVGLTLSAPLSYAACSSGPA